MSGARWNDAKAKARQVALLFDPEPADRDVDTVAKIIVDATNAAYRAGTEAAPAGKKRAKKTEVEDGR